MATRTFCDFCDEQIPFPDRPIRLQCWEDAHPHNGEQSARVVDSCLRCLAALEPLPLNGRFRSMKEKIDKSAKS